jgi:putative ABC transport system permease protein
MYFIIEMLKEAWISISSYKLRSFLTILGIIIGVMAVVLMVSVGEGVQNKINEQFEGLGSNLLIIRPGSMKTRRVTTGSINTLTYEDADTIASLTTIERASYAKSASAQAIYNNNNWNTTIHGVSIEYFDVMNLKIEAGKYFTQREARIGMPYAVIGSEIKKELFNNINPIGEVIRVKNVPLKVIGVLKEKGAGFGGPSQDDLIIIPFKTFLGRLSGSKFPKSVNTVVANVKYEKYLKYSVQKIKDLLRSRHKLKEKDDDDFRIYNLQNLNETVKSTAEMFSILLASIAAISLIVGSIGIMNMMLVSVTERTKEIGLRKAVGAKEKTIMQQFLFEAVLISFVGSMTGLLLGLILAQAGSGILKIKLPMSVSAIILSFIVSIVVGIASGLFPAIKAAKLNPIEALRYE